MINPNLTLYTYIYIAAAVCNNKVTTMMKTYCKNRGSVLQCLRMAQARSTECLARRSHETSYGLPRHIVTSSIFLSKSDDVRYSESLLQGSIPSHAMSHSLIHSSTAKAARSGQNTELESHNTHYTAASGTCGPVGNRTFSV